MMIMMMMTMKCIRQNLTPGCHGNAFPLLSYRFDTFSQTFHEPGMSAFQKCMVNIVTRMVPVTGLANALTAAVQVCSLVFLIRTRNRTARWLCTDKHNTHCY